MTLLSTRMDDVGGKSVRVAELAGPTSDNGAPFVCTHGYPDNLQLYAKLLPLLAAKRRSIAFDWPGLGESETWKGGASPHQKADRLVRLLDAWKIEKATLVGFDMGGQPALLAAAKHPSRVAKVVVMSSLLAHDLPTSWEIRVLRKHALNQKIIRNLPRAVFFRCEKTFLGAGEKLEPDVREDMWRTFARKDVRDFLARMCAGYEASLPKLGDAYGTIQAPVLALWPELDPHFPVAHAEWLTRTARNAQLHVLRGARHWMPYMEPQRVAEAILSFVSAH